MAWLALLMQPRGSKSPAYPSDPMFTTISPGHLGSSGTSA